jgi:hypothetical protein
MTQAVQTAQYGSTDVSLAFKNRIINGAMVIDQRNAGASVTLTSTQTYIIDRWTAAEDTDGTMTAQQSTVAPAGFTNSFSLTTGTADASLSASQFASTRQVIEGFNVADLGWGTANAKTVTVSFWVRSSLTGMFGGSLRNSAINRSYPFSYTISAANTWEQKSVTIAGDTSGTWLTTNGAGIILTFSLGSGSNFEGTAGAWNSNNNTTVAGAVSVIGTAGATWYVTGVQLEVGTQATSFEYRQYQQELALCQRYYYRQTSDGTTTNFYALCAEGATNGAGTGGNFPVPMRTVPTPILGSGIRIFFPSTSVQTPTTGQNRCSSTTAALAVDWTGTSATLGQAGSLFRTNSNGFIEYSAEL